MQLWHTYKNMVAGWTEMVMQSPPLGGKYKMQDACRRFRSPMTSWIPYSVQAVETMVFEGYLFVELAGTTEVPSGGFLLLCVFCTAFCWSGNQYDKEKANSNQSELLVFKPRFRHLSQLIFQQTVRYVLHTKNMC